MDVFAQLELLALVQPVLGLDEEVSEFLDLSLDILGLILEVILPEQILLNIDDLLLLLLRHILVPHIYLVVPQRLKILLGLALHLALLQLGLHLLDVGDPLLPSDGYLGGLLVQLLVSEGVDGLLDLELVSVLLGLVQHADLLHDFCDIDEGVVLEHALDLAFAPAHHLELEDVVLGLSADHIHWVPAVLVLVGVDDFQLVFGGASVAAVEFAQGLEVVVDGVAFEDEEFDWRALS